MNKIGTLASIIIVALIVAGIGAAIATYLMTSNTVTVNVADQETLALTVDKTSVVVGESITLTATASDGAACAGVTCAFLEDTTTLTTVTMNTAGVASYTFNPTVGSHTYTAQADHP